MILKSLKISSYSLVPVCSFVLILFLSAASALIGSDFPQPQDIDIIRDIVDAGFRENYTAAESLAIDLQGRYPYHPVGYVMHAAMLQARMLDDEHFDYDDDFYMLLKLAEKKSKKMLENHPKDAWVWYCLGLTYGSRAVYDSRKGSWWSTLNNGIDSKHAFTECIRSDSTFYDAYIGLGSYHYWRTVKTRVFNWLPFVQDDRKEGLHELELAGEKSMFSVDFAHNSLIWIWMDMKMYEKAESLAIEMQVKYPEGRKFLWPIAYARLEQDDYSGAEKVFIELITRNNTKPNNNHNIVECRYHLAKIYFETGQYQKCIEQCKIVEELNLDENMRKRLRKNLSEINQIREEATRKLRTHLSKTD